MRIGLRILGLRQTRVRAKFRLRVLNLVSQNSMLLYVTHTHIYCTGADPEVEEGGGGGGHIAVA